MWGRDKYCTLATAHNEPISSVIINAKPLAATAAGPSETVDDTVSDGSSEMDGSENDTSSETSGTGSVEDNNANVEDGEDDECVTDEPDALKPSESDALKLSEPALKLSGPDAVKLSEPDVLKPSGNVSEKDENVPASESLPELLTIWYTFRYLFFKSCSFLFLHVYISCIFLWPVYWILFL